VESQINVRLDIRPFPTPHPRDLASLARVTEETRDYHEVLSRWERRVANKYFGRLARLLGINTLGAGPLEPGT
jgi:hypothetical protein